MTLLHNRVSQVELKALLHQETIARTTISFYQYFPIGDTKLFRDELYTALVELQVFGRIYIASEGINAQISVPDINMGNFKNHLNSIADLRGLMQPYLADPGSVLLT